MLAVTLLGAATQLFPAAVPSSNGLIWKRKEGSFALLQKEQIVWQFNFGTNATKPFFHPVALPGGPVLTWDKPADHRWHRALWFSWKFINGVNYWEEDPKTGKAQGRTSWREPQIETRPDFSARIVTDVSYQPDSNGPVVLTEHRVIDVSPPDNDGVYRQDWTMAFTAGIEDVKLDRTPLPGEPDGKLWGGYAGLSVRFAPEIRDPQAISTRETANFTGGRYRGTAEAMDYSGSFDGRLAGIAILDFTANLNSPSPWYVINDGPMHFFTPAVICYKPHTIKAGQSMTLRYQVIVHPGRWSAEQLQQVSGRYTTARP